jgi:tRNA threonylcarbamoyladenosine biosynthesis protein TsaE
LSLTVRCHTEGDTIRIGSAVGDCLTGGDVIALRGELGSGKTTFVKGVARSLGIEETITSPTFVIVSSHEGRVTLHHIDAYRLTEATEEQVREIGILEILSGQCVSAIEWPELIERWLPPDRLDIHFVHADKGRTITLTPCGERFAKLIEEVTPFASARD